MGKIYKYRKITDAITTYSLIEPDYNLLKTNDRIEELATYDGWTYVDIPDDMVLPEQPDQVQLVECESLRVALVNQQVVDMIRGKYSVNDELKILRLATKEPEAFAEYDEYVEECRAWGEVEKAKL